MAVDARELDSMLESTLADRRVSRSERQALAKVLADGSAADRLRARQRAFELIRSRAATSTPAELSLLLDWLEDITQVTTVEPSRPAASAVRAEAYFSPGPDCLDRINAELRAAKRSIDICVFTVTDDRISREVLEAHERGVNVRVITDDEKAHDRGSDVERMERAGISVRTDRTEDHMHHKFAIFDRRLVLTGSYNWTRSAAEFNLENIVILDHGALVGEFARVFDELWNTLG